MGLVGSSLLLILTIVLLTGVNVKAEEKVKKDPSLIGYWKMNEGEGNVVKDSSNYGNNGEIHGGGGIKLKALSGTKDAITVSSFPHPNFKVRNYSRDGIVKMTSGENRGEERVISSFDKEKLTFFVKKPFTCVVEEDDQFTIYFKNSGTVWVEGIEGSCVEFDKTIYIQVAWEPPPKEAFTIEAWVFPYSFYKEYGIAGGSWRYPMLLGTEGKFGALITLTGVKPVKGYSVLEKDKWQHIAVTFDSATGKIELYRNGVNTATVTEDYKHYPFKGETSVVRPGECYWIGSSWREYYLFHGKIDEVKFYNRALSPEEIMKEFSTLKK